MQICLGLAPQSVQRQRSKTSGGKILANVMVMLAGREVGRFLTLLTSILNLPVLGLSQDSRETKLEIHNLV